MTTDHRTAIAAELEFVKKKAAALARAGGLGHEAEDIASFAMLAAFRSADRFDGANVRGWLTEIIKGLIYNGRRHSSFRLTVPLERTGPDGETRLVREPGIGASQETTLQILEVDAALSRLPLEQAEVVRLVTIRGAALEEAACALGLPIGTVKSRLSRGLDALRHQLEHGPRTAASRGGEPRPRRSRAARSMPEGSRPGAALLANAA